MSFISRPGLSIGVLALTLILAACSTAPRQTTYDGTMPDTSRMTVDGMLLKAQKSTYPAKGQLLLLAAGTLLDEDNLERARNTLDRIEPGRLDGNNRNNYSLLEADYAVLTHDSRSALEWLSTISTYNLKRAQRIKYHQIKARAFELEGNFSQNIEQLGQVLQYLPKEDHPALYQTLWNNLLMLNESQLLDLLMATPPDTLKPWIELAVIYRTPGELENQLTELQSWEQRWPISDAVRHLPQSITDLKNAKPYQPEKIALLLPLSGPLAQAGEAVREGFMAAYYEAAKKKLHTPEIQFYDSASGNPVELAQKAEDDGAGLVIGPLGRNAVENATSNSQLAIPQLTLNYADNTQSLSPIYQIGLAAEDEARQGADRAWKDGFRHPVILIPDSDWGQRVANAFNQEWQELGGEVLTTDRYTGNGDFNQAASKLLLVNESQQRANNLRRILGKKLDFTPRRRQDADMIFMAATAANGRQLKPALDFYFAYDLPVYTTSGIYSGHQDPAKDRDLSGIRFPVMPWYLNRDSALKDVITQEWPSSTGQYGSLYALGADVWRLYPRMDQMSRSAGAQMFGATGTLSINTQGYVERHLIWQYFDNGRPRPLTREYSARKTHAIHVLDSNDQEPTG
ncbi:MAG: hypothetical protein B0D91_05500 [Oceanospirillales bacterium LUC14_002_19_P2]|nr:MAG: hypothetical protein B0D91_05500 [Oceanospirillales bacterium LUC14_002_19_P2]